MTQEKCDMHGDHDKRTRDLEQSVAVISSSTEKMSLDITSFIREARQHLAEGRDRLTRLEMQDEQRGKHIELLFQKARKVADLSLPEMAVHIQKTKKSVMEEISKCRASVSVRMGEVEDRIKPIEDIHLKESGRWSMVKDVRIMVPVVCVLITTGLAIWAAIK